MRLPLPSPLFFGVMILLNSACDKKDDDTSTPGTPGNPAPPSPDATFTASVVDSYSNGTVYPAYNGSALIKGPSWQGLYIGDIRLNGLLLDTLYGSYRISSNDVPQLNLSSGSVSWSASGGNGFSPFTHEVNDIAFPSIGPINSPDTIHRSAGHVISVASVEGADSVTFGIGYFMKTLAGNTTSYELTASEAANLPLGSQFAAIDATTYQEVMIEGKRCMFKKMHASVGVIVVVD